MIIPSEVKVWLRNFKVKEVDQEEFKTRNKKGDFLEGEVCWEERTINILKTLDPTEKEITFFHELVHVASDLSGAALPEAKITGIGHMLYFMLEDNGLFTKPTLIPGEKKEGGK